MRIVVDTNVWVAAVRSRRGASFALLSMVDQSCFTFGVSVPLYLQYRAKFADHAVMAASGLSEERRNAVLAALAHFAAPVPIYFQLRPNLRDENDNMVFECAANFGARIIVTHNIRDFRGGELRAYGIEPVEPGAFLRMLEE